MENYHSLLKKQTRRHFNDIETLSEDVKDFIKSVDYSYNEFDSDRTMLERSLDLSSQELLQANADMRAVFNTSPDLFIWIDKEGVIIDSKGGKESDLYLPVDKLIGKKIQNIPIKSLGIKFQKAVKRVFKTKSITSINYSLKKNNNENFYEARLLPLTDNQIITIIRNTTEAKKAEHDLIRKNRFETIISSVTKSVHSSIDLSEVLQSSAKSILKNMDGVDAVGIYMVEEKLAILKAHAGLTENFISRAGEIRYPNGFTWKTLIDNKVLYCADVEKDKYIGPAGIRLGTKSYVSMPINYEGKPVGTINTHSFNKNSFDQEQLNLLKIVTQQIEVAIRNANKADELRQSEERYRTLFDQSPIGICIFDKDMTITQCNNAMVNIYQSSYEKIIGLNMHKLNDKTFLPIVEDALKGKTARHESLYETSTSSAKLHLLTSVVPLKDPNGKVDGVMGVVEDITKRKQDEQEILRLNTDLEKRVAERTIQLRAANNELEAFSYSVSHDLRSPLRAMDGFSQAILEDYQEILDEKGKDYLGRIRTASQRMSELIDDLLNLSRLTRSEMKFIEVNLSKLVKFHAGELLTSDYKRRVSFNIENDVIVKGDPKLLDIAVENLLGNAWKFTSRKSSAIIEFGVKQEFDNLIYFVKDNGAGFNMKYSDKLFGPFQRLHSEPEFRGSGIGLATVQRIITRHGGKIWAKGAPGKGATFFFTL